MLPTYDEYTLGCTGFTHLQLGIAPISMFNREKTVADKKFQANF
jgi:hypothetical protein